MTSQTVVIPPFTQQSKTIELVNPTRTTPERMDRPVIMIPTRRRVMIEQKNQKRQAKLAEEERRNKMLADTQAQLKVIQTRLNRGNRRTLYFKI